MLRYSKTSFLDSRKYNKKEIKRTKVYNMETIQKIAGAALLKFPLLHYILLELLLEGVISTAL
jgi:hypothetical protein